MEGDLEQLAYDTAREALDKQERLLEEIRSRTGVLLAASSLAASFLGREAFVGRPPSILVGLALLAFTVSVGASVRVLMPKKNLVFALSGTAVYERYYELRHDLPEIHRRLAYQLVRFWEANDGKLSRLFATYRVAAVALTAEILALIGLVSDKLV